MEAATPVEQKALRWLMLTLAQFEAEAQTLAAASVKADGCAHWEWCGAAGESAGGLAATAGYLRQRLVRRHDSLAAAGGVLSSQPEGNAGGGGDDDDDDDVLAECALLPEEDTATLRPAPRETSEVTCEVHVAYSVVYSEPVLLFNKYHAGGSMLSQDEIWQTILQRPGQGEALPAGIRGHITQGEHPVLGSPFYFVHPCQTSGGDCLRGTATATGTLSPQPFPPCEIRRAPGYAAADRRADDRGPACRLHAGCDADRGRRRPQLVPAAAGRSSGPRSAHRFVPAGLALGSWSDRRGRHPAGARPADHESRGPRQGVKRAAARRWAASGRFSSGPMAALMPNKCLLSKSCGG